MKIKLSLVAVYLCCLNAHAQDVKIEEIDIAENTLMKSSLINSKKTITTDEKVSTSLSDSLKKEFYVEFKKSGDYANEPYIRGRGNKGVPVFIEGMRLNAGHDDSTNLFALTDIAEIDVYRGANGATLGMGAMSGAVVVKFKEPKFGDTKEVNLSGFANAKGSFLSKDGYSSSLGTTLYNDIFNLSLGGGFNNYNNYEDGNSDEILHSEYETSNYNGSLSIKTSPDSYVYARYMKDDAQSSDPTTRWYNPSNGFWTYTDRPNDEAKSYFAGFKKMAYAGLSNLEVQYFKNELHYDYNVKREAAIEEQQELFRESKTDGLKLSAQKDLSNHHLAFSSTYSNMYITNGVRTYNYGTSSWNPWQKAFGITEGEIKSFMLNVSDEIQYDKTFFNLAAGYEYVKRDVISNINSAKFATLVPAVLLSQTLKENTNEEDNLLSLSATIGYEVSSAFIPYFKLSNATRTPYFNEQYGNNPSNGSQIPNQTLKNEKVYGADIGADGQIDKFYYSTALFYQKYKDYIELVDTGYKTTPTNLTIKQYINLDEATVYGAELLMGYEIADDIFAEATYTQTHGENEDDNQPLAYITPQKLKLSLAQRKKKGLSWEVVEELVDKQDRISAINGEKETAGYALTNASVSYAFGELGIFKSAVVSFELNNIFDKNYSEHLSKASSTAYYTANEAGINGALALQVKF